MRPAEMDSIGNALRPLMEQRDKLQVQLLAVLRALYAPGVPPKEMSLQDMLEKVEQIRRQACVPVVPEKDRRRFLDLIADLRIARNNERDDKYDAAEKALKGLVLK